MRIRLSQEESVFLKDQLDIWIEGYMDIDGEVPHDVVVELIENKETAERIRNKIWKKLQRRS